MRGFLKKQFLVLGVLIAGAIIILRPVELRAQEIQAKTESVEGCGGSFCFFTIAFNSPFSNVPTVVCSAGPSANPSWGPMICTINSVDVQSVVITLDSANPGQPIMGTKDIHVIGFASPPA